ncbi:MAG TPA: haloacid dehalogenase-like hydrolase, partial [Archangium sp.]|nr:haloacid dehalogenase-like hydrolase [Archangium sp.]
MPSPRRSRAGFRLSTLALAGCLASGVLACPGPQGPEGAEGPQGTPGKDGVPTPVRLLDDKVGRWLPENRTRLNGMISSLGLASPTFDPKNRPVAVFDWDNTVVKNDLGDATFFWMLEHDKVLQPADKDWSTTSRHLTVAARAALNGACDAAANPGEPLQTRAHAGCADELVSIYNRGLTRAGQAAWDNPITLTINTAYAWVAQLQAGYTPEEVRAFARSAYAENAFNPPGTTQTVGTTTGLAYHVQ